MPPGWSPNCWKRDGRLLERFFRFLGEGMPEDVRADLHREAFRPAVVVTQGRQARTFLTELHAWQGDPPALPDVPVTVISGSLADGMPRRVRDAATAAGRYRAAQSRQGRHVVAARSGHYIPATESDLIAAEIRRPVLDSLVHGAASTVRAVPCRPVVLTRSIAGVVALTSGVRASSD